MNNLIRIIALTILLLIINWFYPIWWFILVIPFLFTALFTKKLMTGFGNGFVAGLLAWGGMVAYQYFTGAQHIANRMAAVFQLPGKGITMLIMVALLGAILASLGGITGSSLRTVIRPNKKGYNYY